MFSLLEKSFQHFRRHRTNLIINHFTFSVQDSGLRKRSRTSDGLLHRIVLRIRGERERIVFS